MTVTASEERDQRQRSDQQPLRYQSEVRWRERGLGREREGREGERGSEMVVRVVDFEFERELSVRADKEALHWSISVT